MRLSTESLRKLLFVLLFVIANTIAGYSVVTIDSIQVSHATCGNADGSFEVFASGDAPFTYSSDSGATFQQDSSFQNLAPGSYYVYIQGALGELDSVVVNIFGLGGVVFDSINTQDPQCSGDQNGSIEIFASSGTPPYFYSIDSGATFQPASLFTSLGAGVYNVIVMDDDSCIAVQQVTLTDPLPVTYSVTITDANCPASDGIFDFTASGGDGNYQFSIDGGSTFQPGNVFLNLPVGGYNIVITDGNGCTVTGTEFVGSTPGNGPDIVTLNYIDPLCNGSNNGSITIFATGAPTIQYSIDGGNTFSASGAFTGLPPATYDIVVEDGNGCLQAVQISMTEPAALTTNPTIMDETCAGGNGSIEFSTIGGTPPYQFSIDNGTTFSSDSSFTNLSGGTYNYVVEDQQGCTSLGQLALNTGGGPTIQNIALTDPSCPLENDGSIVISAIGNGSITYSINGGSTSQANGIFTGLTAGQYNIYLVDGDGCVTTQTVSIIDPSTPSADFDTNPTSGVQPLDVSFTDQSTGAVNYFWDFGDGNSSTAINPTNTYTSEGTFQVILVVDDGNCTDTAYSTVMVQNEPGLRIPNVFTPNGDGVNDVFMVEAVGMEELHSKIYNRWGEIVGEWRGPNGWWDGRTMPAGQLCPEGTYFYVITASGLDGEPLEETGSITLLR